MQQPNQQIINKLKWFHSINFGNGIISKSWVYEDRLPPNYHLFSVYYFLEKIDVNGMDCLDLGTYDGIMAFILRKLGANLTATCQHNREQFKYCQSVFGYEDIEYLPKLQIEEMAKKFQNRYFDLIVLSSMLHHLISPLQALTLCRNLLKEQGLLIIEAAFFPGKDPILTLNTEIERPVYGCPNIWMPTENALCGMLKLSSFRILGKAKLVGTERAREKNYRRMAFLVQAIKPSEIQDKLPQLKELHEKTSWIENINFHDLEKKNAEKSKIQYKGKKGNTNIDIWNFKTVLPLQPKWKKP